MPEADAAIAAAKAQVDLAQLTFNRMQDLFNKRSVTPQELDESSARLKSAQAGLDMARARRTQLNSKLAQTEQEVRSAGIQRTYAVVAAPFSGTIVTRSIEPGALAMPGAPLFTIERDAGFRLEASVEESRLGTIRAGQSARIDIDGINQEIRARVSEIVPAVDAASRTGIVKFDLPALPGLRTGLFGRAAFDAGPRDALAIPHAAVVERGQLQSVFVADGNVARLRVVSLGARSGGQVEVLSGLDAGERVVHTGAERLRDGSPIEVRP
jgi:RND family efflux transporter MFP subunit